MNNNDICGVLRGGGGGGGRELSAGVHGDLQSVSAVVSNKPHGFCSVTYVNRGPRRGVTTELRRTSWAAVPNKPTVSVDIKQHFDNNNNRGYHSLHTLQHNTGR